MSKINAVLLDNQKLFAEGFSVLLKSIEDPQVDVIEMPSRAEDALSILSSQDVDLLFMELNLPDQDGMSFILKLKEHFPSVRVCILTAYTDHKFVKSAFINGADGYYAKHNSSDELLHCINDIMAGKTFISDGLYITPPQKTPKVLTNGKSKFMEDRFLLRQKLTKREQEVLSLITKAMNNKEIAERLYISDQTVGVHRKNIMRKLGVRNTVNLIRFAIDHQLV